MSVELKHQHVKKWWSGDEVAVLRSSALKTLKLWKDAPANKDFRAVQAHTKQVMVYKYKLLTFTELDDPCNDDDNEGQYFGVGEYILHSGTPLDIGSVYECQQTWKSREHLFL